MPRPDCPSHPRSEKALSISEILWPERNIMACAQAQQHLVLDHKAGTSGTDNRFKIVSYLKASGQIHTRK